jgi:hypothetical protein
MAKRSSYWECASPLSPLYSGSRSAIVASRISHGSDASQQHPDPPIASDRGIASSSALALDHRGHHPALLGTGILRRYRDPLLGRTRRGR